MGGAVGGASHHRALWCQHLSTGEVGGAWAQGVWPPHVVIVVSLGRTGGALGASGPLMSAGAERRTRGVQLLGGGATVMKLRLLNDEVGMWVGLRPHVRVRVRVMEIADTVRRLPLGWVEPLVLLVVEKTGAEAGVARERG